MYNNQNMVFAPIDDQKQVNFHSLTNLAMYIPLSNTIVHTRKRRLFTTFEREREKMNGKEVASVMEVIFMVPLLFLFLLYYCCSFLFLFCLVLMWL